MSGRREAEEDENPSIFLFADEDDDGGGDVTAVGYRSAADSNLGLKDEIIFRAVGLILFLVGELSASLYKILTSVVLLPFRL